MVVVDYQNDIEVSMLVIETSYAVKQVNESNEREETEREDQEGERESKKEKGNQKRLSEGSSTPQPIRDLFVHEILL